MSLLVADPKISQGVNWALGTVELVLPAFDAAPSKLTAQNQPVNNQKPIISHIFVSACMCMACTCMHSACTQPAALGTPNSTGWETALPCATCSTCVRESQTTGASCKSHTEPRKQPVRAWHPAPVLHAAPARQAATCHSVPGLHSPGVCASGGNNRLCGGRPEGQLQCACCVSPSSS